MDKDISLLKTLFDKASNLYLNNKYVESLNLISNTSEMWIDYSQKYKFLSLIGMNYYKLENYTRAERPFLESLAIKPDNIKVLDLLGNIYFIQGRYIESEKVFLLAMRNDFCNYNFSIKTAKSAWKSGNLLRMVKRLKEGYIPEFIGKKEEKNLKLFLLDFLQNSNIPEAYNLIKNFRKWCYEQKKKYKKSRVC